MKGRASLLKSLTRLDRCSKTCLACMETDSKLMLKSGKADELAQTSREIVRVQLNMMRLSRALAGVSKQIRGLMIGKTRSLALPTRLDAATNNTANNYQVNATGVRQRFAFTAIITEMGPVVARVLADTLASCPLEEYGYFETWTQAQDFATVLNQMHGIDSVEVQHIVVSASLASRCGKETCPR